MRLATGASALLLAAGGCGHALFSRVNTAIARIDPFDGLSNRPQGGEGLNVLVVGTDGRHGLPRKTRRTYHLGGAPCHCTDTIMLVHLSADRRRASVVSIPRDSYVRLPVHSRPSGVAASITGASAGSPPATGPVPTRPEKINAAYTEGGPPMTVRVVEEMTGLHIDHYLEVDFTSFMRTVDALGGVEICTPRPLRDSWSGLNLPAGTSRLNGGRALQYVRSRHVDAASDFGRMRRQQRFLAALVDKASSAGVLMNPVAFRRVSSALLGSVRADPGFDADALADLGRAMRGFEPSSSEFVSIPVADADFTVPGVGSTVTWDRERADRIFRTLRADRPLAARRRTGPRPVAVEVPPGQVRVEVGNGTRRPGLDRRVTEALRASGFTIAAAAGPAASPARHTVVAYDPSWNRSVRTIAAALPGATLRPVPGQGPVMHVTLGADFRRTRPVRAKDAPPSGAGPRAAPAIPAVTGDQVLCR